MERSRLLVECELAFKYLAAESRYFGGEHLRIQEQKYIELAELVSQWRKELIKGKEIQK